MSNKKGNLIVIVIFAVTNLIQSIPINPELSSARIPESLLNKVSSDDGSFKNKSFTGKTINDVYNAPNHPELPSEVHVDKLYTGKEHSFPENETSPRILRNVNQIQNTSTIPKIMPSAVAMVKPTIRSEDNLSNKTTTDEENYRNETFTIKNVNGANIIAREGVYAHYFPNGAQIIVYYVADENGYVARKVGFYSSLTRFPVIQAKAILSLLGG